jgi:hypothetical protein
MTFFCSVNGTGHSIVQWREIYPIAIQGRLATANKMWNRITSQDSAMAIAYKAIRAITLTPSGSVVKKEYWVSVGAWELTIKH